jgi:hypothetical protein
MAYHVTESIPPSEAPMDWLSAIDTAADRIAHHIYCTPAVRAPELGADLDTNVWLKLENHQLTGSFKARGGTNKILALSTEQRSRGLVTASSGNHGAGTAHAAAPFRRKDRGAHCVRGEHFEHRMAGGYTALNHGASMFKTSLIAFICALSLSTAFAEPETQPADNWVSYGAEIGSQSTPIPAKDLLADPSSFEGKTILVEGRIADVCQKMGCWMVIAEGDKSMRVLTRAHKFYVAKDSTGQTCRIEGTISSKKIDPATVAHFEGESANVDAMPEHKSTTGQVYEFNATGIQINRPPAE